MAHGSYTAKVCAKSESGKAYCLEVRRTGDGRMIYIGEATEHQQNTSASTTVSEYDSE